MRMDRYCSSMVHLLREGELGFRNALTDNVTTRCTKHKMLQTCDNIIGCNDFFYDDVYLSLDTCHSVIRGSHNENYKEPGLEPWPHTKVAIHLDRYDVYVQHC